MHAIVTHVRGKRETHVAPVFTRDEIPSLKVWIRPADHGRSQPLVVMTDFVGCTNPTVSWARGGLHGLRNQTGDEAMRNIW